MEQPDNQPTGLTAGQLPRTVAICPDGNARWAAKRGLSTMEGHFAGGDVAFRRVRDACELGIEQLSLFGFSTENWTRSASEIAGLMDVFAATFDRGIVALAPLGIRLKVVGSRSGLPQSVLDAVDRAEEATSKNDRMDLFVAINYGGRQEMLDAAQRYSGGVRTLFGSCSTRRGCATRSDHPHRRRPPAVQRLPLAVGLLRTALRRRAVARLQPRALRVGAGRVRAAGAHAGQLTPAATRTDPEQSVTVGLSAHPRRDQLGQRPQFSQTYRIRFGGRQ